MTRILITGADGQLGRAFREHFAGHAEVYGRSADECPVEHRARVLEELQAIQPDVVLHAAALTDVDACERDPERALATNALGARHVAEASRAVGARLVHISTDYVFDGRAGRPLDERDTPAPVNAYGRSKLRGEREVAQAHPDALICRVAYLFGASPRSFLRRMLQRAVEQPTLRITGEQRGNPTWTVDVAAQIAVLLEAGESGLFHTVSNGGCSRFELVQFALAHLGRDTEVVEASAAEFPTAAPRPPDTRLRNRRLDQRSLNRMPDWQTAVARYLDTLEEPSP